MVLWVVACASEPSGPTPNIEATVEARLVQERAVDATVEAKIEQEREERSRAFKEALDAIR